MKNQTGREVIKMYYRTYIFQLFLALAAGAFLCWAYIVPNYQLIAF